MSVTTHFTPILGALDDGPLCYLLEIDNCRILLDCGWDDSFSVEQLEILEKEIKKGFDAVLLSHLDISHIGALPYVIGKLGLKAPVYATTPIRQFGKIMFYDVYSSKTNEQNFDIFSLEDVDAAFDDEIFRVLRYDQPEKLENFDIEITPHRAGHLIGGSFWKIQKETDNIIYAVDNNINKERHLKQSALMMIKNPSLMITDARKVTVRKEKRKDLDIDLLRTIESTVLRGGDVLLPVDTAGRVLELLLLLEQEWKKLNVKKANITFLSNTSYTAQDFARSHLEWMNPKDLDMSENPFDFHYISICSSMEEFEQIAPPRVVLATVPTLECGFSRSLFSLWGSNPNNIIIFTTKQRNQCLASQLFEKYEQEQKKSSSSSSSVQFSLTFEQRKRVNLEGEELEEYYLNLAEKQKLEEEQQEIQEELINQQEDIKMEDEEELEERIPLLASSYFEGSFDYFIDQSDHLSSRGHPMFPFQEENSEWDLYGEIVDLTDISNKQQLDSDGNLSSLPSGDLDMMNENYVDDDENEMKEELPTKPIVEIIQLNVCCKMKFIDFDGKSDGGSMKNLLCHISPRKVILIHGTKDACDDLSSLCKNTKECSTTEFFIPSVGERIDVTSGTVIFKLKLSDTFTNTKFHYSVGGYRVAYIDGKINYRSIQQQQQQQENENISSPPPPLEKDKDGDVHFTENDDENDKAKSFDNELNHLEPYLVEIAENQRPAHDTVIMGTSSLPVIRDVLLKKDFNVVLSQGVLYCNNLITIRRSQGSAHFRVDGPLCDDYFQIRDLLYQQFSVL